MWDEGPVGVWGLPEDRLDSYLVCGGQEAGQWVGGEEPGDRWGAADNLPEGASARWGVGLPASGRPHANRELYKEAST